MILHLGVFGSELQNYFTKILEDNLKAIIKPQYVDQIPKAVKVRKPQIKSVFSVRTSLRVKMFS